jgi:uncharacterized protein (DUF302 family)
LGFLTEIDVMATLKKKRDVDFRTYRILGASNPQYAHKALLVEEKIGAMLPCTVIVQEHEPGVIEVSAIDPVQSMGAVENGALVPAAFEVRAKLKRVIEA